MKSTKKKILIAGVAAAAVGVVGAVLYKMLKEIDDAMLEIDRETAEGYYPFGFDSEDPFADEAPSKRKLSSIFKKSKKLIDIEDDEETEDDEDDFDDDFDTECDLSFGEDLSLEDEEEDIFSDEYYGDCDEDDDNDGDDDLATLLSDDELDKLFSDEERDILGDIIAGKSLGEDEDF